MAKIKNTHYTKILERWWSNQNFHSVLTEMKNDATTLGKSLVTSYKIKYTPTLLPSNSTQEK